MKKKIVNVSHGRQRRVKICEAWKGEGERRESHKNINMSSLPLVA